MNVVLQLAVGGPESIQERARSAACPAEEVVLLCTQDMVTSASKRASRRASIGRAGHLSGHIRQAQHPDDDCGITKAVITRLRPSERRALSVRMMCASRAAAP